MVIENDAREASRITSGLSARGPPKALSGSRMGAMDHAGKRANDSENLILTAGSAR